MTSSSPSRPDVIALASRYRVIDPTRALLCLKSAFSRSRLAESHRGLPCPAATPKGSSKTLLPAQVSLIPQPFGIGRKLWVNHTAAGRLSDIARRFADSIQKRLARISHEVPSVGDLISMRQSLRDCFALSTAATPRKNRDRRMFGKPCTRHIHRAIQQLCSGFPLLEIANDRSIGLAPSEGKAIGLVSHIQGKVLTKNATAIESLRLYRQFARSPP